MSLQTNLKRNAAVMVADSINKIEGVPVSQYARKLSAQWASGEITGSQMKSALIEKHTCSVTGMVR